MKDITINRNITIRQAMKVLQKTSEKCLLVVDENKKLLGTLTDGDLRRSILRGVQFSESISDSYKSNPTILVHEQYNLEEAKQILRVRKLDLIPIVDRENKVVDYLTWSNMNGGEKIKKTLDNVPVVIMAGGKGTQIGRASCRERV